MKKVAEFFKNFIFIQLGALCGYSVAEYLNYKKHPGFYALLGKPWYSQLYFKIAATAIIVTFSLVIFLFARAKTKSRINSTENTDNG